MSPLEVASSPRHHAMAGSEALPTLRAPVCGKLGNVKNLQRTWPREAMPPAPPGHPVSNAYGKGVESAVRRPDLCTAASPRYDHERHLDFGSGAYPAQSAGGMTQRPPADIAPPRGAGRRPASLRRAPSCDAGSGRGEKSGDCSLPPVPLTARERYGSSPEEALGGSGSSAFSERGRDRSGSRRTRTKQPPAAPQKARSGDYSCEKPAATSSRKSQASSHRPASPRCWQASSPGSTDVPSSLACSGYFSPATSPAGHSEFAGTALNSFSSPPVVEQKKEQEPQEQGASPFRSILEEMEREREMWNDKTISLMSGSRPGTASGSRPASSAGHQAAEAGKQAAEAASQDSREAHAPEPEATLAPEDADLGESLIAQALWKAGMDPSVVAVSDLEPQNLEQIDDRSVEADSRPSSRRESWQASSQNWAAERARRKKERLAAGLRSGAGTPCGSTGSLTPDMSSEKCDRMRRSHDC
eukprot:TRINITY_DN59573_c0_g1_i1.p1 TRINITY_DN59573_c0_g1~~TRINITY_DN59573_c0_g1_i1.p1  ORF type:complete len:472 (+),score=87.25 TRINITY_DN59573_c0_g1_i1:36-1451(+)